MRTVCNYIFVLFFAMAFIGCEEDLETFNDINGQTALSFDQTSFNISVPQENVTLEIPVSSTTSSNVERNFNVSIDMENTTTGTSGEYSIGSITIPPLEHTGILSVDFIFSNIGGMDGDTKSLVLNIDAPEDSFAFNDAVSITYFREIVCNDLELEIVSDIFGTETSYEILDSQGMVVASNANLFSANSCTQMTYNESINLPDGDYVFRIIDSFGDGQVGQNDGCGPDDVIGTYKLSCSIIVHAEGGGAWGASEETPFSINP